MLRSPYVLLILATLFWGGNFALGRAVSGSIPPMTLSYIRWIEALIFFLPFCWKEVWDHREILSKNYKTFVLLGVTGVVGFNMCVYIAVSYTTAINASLINSFAPVVVTVMSIVFLKDKLNARQWIGIVISLVGVIWIVARGNWHNLVSLTFNTGDLVMVLAVLLWGAYNIILKKDGKIVPARTLFIASIVGGLASTFPLIIYENYNTGLAWINQLNTVHYLSLLYFGIFPTILSFQFFNKAMLEIGPSKAAPFAHLVVVFASIFGILFLKEKFIIAHFIGGLLIIVGLYATSKPIQTSNKKINGTY